MPGQSKPLNPALSFNWVTPSSHPCRRLPQLNIATQPSQKPQAAQVGAHACWSKCHPVESIGKCYMLRVSQSRTSTFGSRLRTYPYDATHRLSRTQTIRHPSEGWNSVRGRFLLATFKCSSNQRKIRKSNDTAPSPRIWAVGHSKRSASDICKATTGMGVEESQPITVT